MMKEIDVARAALLDKKRKKTGKNTLNMEELLEVSREQYDTETIEPGRLHELLLQKNRIW